MLTIILNRTLEVWMFLRMTEQPFNLRNSAWPSGKSRMRQEIADSALNRTSSSGSVSRMVTSLGMKPSWF
jgi:hypothetical protein